jgi:hypothetical protein
MRINIYEWSYVFSYLLTLTLTLLFCYQTGDKMIAYEFYWHGEAEGSHQVGVLPQRRTDPQRITKELIMNWGKSVVGDDLEAEKLSFTQVEI